MRTSATKSALRLQQRRLAQLERYLPTLQLRKQQLQLEVRKAKEQWSKAKEKEKRKERELHLPLWQVPLLPLQGLEITSVEDEERLVAGIPLPWLEKVHFREVSYPKLSTPLWSESLIEEGRKLLIARRETLLAERRLRILQENLRLTHLRVNLFERVLIPRCMGDIKRIKLFLSDQELAAVAQAKVARSKLERR